MHSTIRPGRIEYEEVRVQAERLEDILQRLGVDKVDLLKVDVEGSERPVLEGLGMRLRNVKKIIYEVTHNTNCESLLTNYGFKISKIIFDKSICNLAIKNH